MTDLYKLLGIEKTATPEQIKRAFRKLSKKLHPDVGGNAKSFHEIEQAYRVLSDPDERAYYDQNGTARVKEEERNPNTELYRMLGEVMMGAMAEMKNPATEDLLKNMTGKMRESIARLQELIKQVEKAITITEAVMKRITAKTPENVLLSLLKTQLDVFTTQLERGVMMTETLKKGIEFLKDYDYETTKLLMSSDLAEALRRQASGKYDDFFTLKTR